MFTLTNEQLDAYRKDGYVLVHDLLTDEEIVQFTKAVPDIANRNFPGGSLLGHVVDDAYRTIAHHPSITGPASQIIGGPIKIVQTMYLEKMGSGPGTAPHQDIYYLRNEPDTLMACWVALSDTDEENGGLCVIPGSQKTGFRAGRKTDNTADHIQWEVMQDLIDPDGRKYQEPMVSFEIDGLDQSSFVPLTIPRGAGVFFNGWLVHGSFENRAPQRPRLAFATHYVHQDTWLYRQDIHDAVPVSA
jgi:phytanoyl-CoA hydroxylase